MRRTKAQLIDELEAMERARAAGVDGVMPEDLEVRFHHAFENAPIGMALITPDGNRFKVNQALADFLGYSIDELTNTTIGSTSANDAELAQSLRLRQDVIDGKRRTYTNTRRYQRKSGEIVWGEVTGSLVRHADGTPAYFVAHTVDVTERRRAREALQASETRFRDFAEVSSDWFWEMDADLRYTFVSEAYARIAGRPPEKLIGRTRREMYTGYIAEERAAWMRFLDALDAHDDIEDFIYTYDRPDGSRRVFRNSARAVFAADGAFAGYRGVGVDITREVEITNSLRAAKEEADRANAAKSRFLTNMSHEIRTPLTAIIGLSQMALDEALADKPRDLVGKVNKAGTHLLDVVNDILDFSRIEADVVALERENFMLAEVIADAVQINATHADEKGLHLSTEIDIDAPDQVCGDALRLTQILNNLIANAVKFTETGQVAVRAGVLDHDADGVHLAFQVADTGIGIPADAIANLFDPFTQADESTTRRHGGTGLGLAIAKRLVETMGGAIGVDSVPGEGSTFTFDIFTARAAPNRAAAPPPEPNPVVTAGGRILLVDDNDTNLMIAKAVLDAAGFSVAVAHDGAEAVAMATETPADFDAVLMDLQMPVMDGYEATRRILTMPAFADLPIVALTAHAFEEEKQKCAAAGMKGHVPKPIDARQLVETLRAAMR